MNAIPGLTVAGFITCWAISPDAIVRLTNLAGLGMKTAVPAIIFACLFSLLCSLFINHASRIRLRAGEIAAPVKTTFFALFSELLRLTAILGICLLLPTGMLVSAGFTFNETFLYWFPNFGFSFLLLGIVTGLHFCGTRFINLSQLIFFLITAGCILAIAVAGLIISPVYPTESTPEGASLLSAAAASTLLFLGYDFESSHYGLNSRPQSWTILLLTGAGFCLWLTAAYLHVPPEKLSSSTIPHLIFARQTMGDNGRILIGIAIISGTCLLTNGLFFQAGSLLQNISVKIQVKQSNYSGLLLRYSRFYPVILALLIGAMLAGGMAGSEKLEFFIQGALLFWLLSTSLWLASHALRYRGRALHQLAGGIILSSIALLIFIFLLVSHPEWLIILGYSAAMLIGTLLATVLCKRCSKHVNMQQKPTS